MYRQATLGAEAMARIARGAMLYDASRVSQPAEPLFEPAWWRERGALEETAGGRGTIAFLRDGSRRWVLRHYCRGGLMVHFSQDAYLWTGEARARSFVEWRLLRQLVDWQLPVPVPVAARYVRAGLRYRADLITEELPTRLTVAQALRAGPIAATVWRDIGRCVGRLHDRGVHHADLNAHNLLLGEEETVYVLDFDRGRIRDRGAWEQDVLQRLRRSLVKVTVGLPADRFDESHWQALLEGCER
jgi:3-deoxy-D-manno-octulosonic acid kinase